MISKIKSKFLIVIVFNLIIAVGYYFENLDVTYSKLSSDLLNIIPIAQKFDNPDLYKYDLYVDSLENVKYYTPFYVQSLRFIAKFCDYNYLQALNIMHTMCHFIFGILWFLLFYKYGKNFWVAFLMSIFVRGIVWIPGFEILGISGLWSMMPRTLYITLFPIPFLILSNKLWHILLASFFTGFVFNFHPITGLSGVLLFILFLIFYYQIFKPKIDFSLKNTTLVALTLVLGMLPFIATYFSKTSSSIHYDLGLFEKAFSERIPEIFSNPFEFVILWIKRKSILFIVPVIVFYLLSKKYIEDFKKAKILIFLTLGLFFLPLLTVYVEQMVNSLFKLNFRLSFQLIRTQKMVLIPCYFAILFLFNHFLKNMQFKKVFPFIVSVFFLVLVFSKSEFFKSIPVLNADVFKSVLPFNLSISKPSQIGNKTKDAMARYIEANTRIDAIIFGDYFYRSASKRSVILDDKGASMIIEGNPKKLTQWYKDKQYFKALKTFDEKFEFLRSLGVDYYVTENDTYNLEVVHKIDEILLYKL